MELQDFPSIYQVLEKLIENDIITIFSVAKNITGGMGILSAYDLYSVSLLCVCVCVCVCVCACVVMLYFVYMVSSGAG